MLSRNTWRVVAPAVLVVLLAVVSIWLDHSALVRGVFVLGTSASVMYYTRARRLDRAARYRAAVRIAELRHDTEARRRDGGAPDASLQKLLGFTTKQP